VYDTKFDFNKDGIIDDLDAEVIKEAYGSYSPEKFPNLPIHEKWNPECDFNGSGVVDAADWALFAAHYGETKYATGYSVQPVEAPLIVPELGESKEGTHLGWETGSIDTPESEDKRDSVLSKWWFWAGILGAAMLLKTGGKKQHGK
jgi:hypothetical protein